MLQCVVHADGLMVTSTTVTGLQLLIDTAVKHITERGLLFNQRKDKMLHKREKFLCE